MAVTAESPEISSFKVATAGDTSPSPLTASPAGSSFRELDDAFLQTQTRIWLGEVLEIRFDEDINISDLLADGELLFEVSEVLSRMLQTPAMEAPQLKLHEWKSLASSKSTKRYMPYFNVGSFLRMCKNLGLNGIDLFSPSDVVEKRNIRKVCMCLRSLSKKVRSKELDVPDFDSVTCTLAMPTDMVEGIRKSLELSQSSSSLSVGHDLEKVSRIRYWRRMSNTTSAVSNGYSDVGDEAESRLMGSESNGPSDNEFDSTSPNFSDSEVIRDYCASPELLLNMGDQENEENVQCEYLSPTISESVGSPCSQYYVDQELSNTPSSICLASRISGLKSEIHGCQNRDVSSVPIDWGDISLDDGYRDGNASTGEMGHVSHDKEDSENACDSDSPTRERKTCNLHTGSLSSSEIGCEKNLHDYIEQVRCQSSHSAGGRDLDMSIECPVQDLCVCDTTVCKFDSPENEQVDSDADAVKHGTVACYLNSDICKPCSDKMVNENDTPNDLLRETTHVTSFTQNPDSSSNDGNCASQVSNVSMVGENSCADGLCHNVEATSADVAGGVRFQVDQSSVSVDSDVHGSNRQCPTAIMSNGTDYDRIHSDSVAHHQEYVSRDGGNTVCTSDIDNSETKMDNMAFDANLFASDHTEECKDNDSTGDNAGPLDMPDVNSSPYLDVAKDSMECSEKDSPDTHDESEIDIIDSKLVSTEDPSTSVDSCPLPEAESPQKVEDTAYKNHHCAENVDKGELAENGTDKEMPQTKPIRALLKSVAKGTALVGVAAFLLHLRRNNGLPLPKLKKQPIEVLKRSMPKPSSQKGEKVGNAGNVYPSSKLNLGV